MTWRLCKAELHLRTTTPWGTCRNHNAHLVEVTGDGWVWVNSCYRRVSHTFTSVFWEVPSPVPPCFCVCFLRCFSFSPFSLHSEIKFLRKSTPAVITGQILSEKWIISGGASWEKRKLSRFRVLLGFLAEKRWRRLCRRAQMTAAVRGKYERKIEQPDYFGHSDEPVENTWGPHLPKRKQTQYLGSGKPQWQRSGSAEGGATSLSTVRLRHFWVVFMSCRRHFNRMLRPPRYTRLKVPFHKSRSFGFR